MASPDVRHSLPPQDTGFGRFGSDVGAHFQSWLDFRLGVEIGGVRRRVETPLGEPIATSESHVSMFIALPFVDRTRTRDHNTLFVLPRPGSYDLISAHSYDPEFFAPSDVAVQMTDWVVNPQEVPIGSLLRNADRFPIDGEPLYVPTHPVEKGAMLQETVDRAVARREREAVHELPVDDQALQDVLGPDLFTLLREAS
jgi:hypothetical protein